MKNNHDPTVDRCIPILMRLTRSRNSNKWVTKVYQRHLYFDTNNKL